MVASETMRNALKEIVETLSVDYRPRQVILLGSYAYSSPGPDSDIDLLIIKDTADRFIDRWMAVRRILADPKRMLPLETLVLTPDEVASRLRVGDQLLQEILEKGEVLYEA